MNRNRHKDKLKTDPTGVRFDKKKLLFIQDREGLRTPQQVVNYLLDEYWWKVHVIGVGAERDLHVFSKSLLGEVKTNVYKIKDKGVVLIKTVAEYIQEKREIESPEVFKEFLLRLEADPNLGKIDKTIIKNS